MEYVYLNKEVIYSNIRNLSQVTFEVTDACNLQCKYCGPTIYLKIPSCICLIEKSSVTLHSNKISMLLCQKLL